MVGGEVGHLIGDRGTEQVGERAESKVYRGVGDVGLGGDDLGVEVLRRRIGPVWS